ncbi:MAG: MFS transporter [Erwinia billingiae]|jgi:MFS family permease|uniref:Major facilitator transporter n=1 Tax=Erwinia billingiae (strain Eb661) TaxID=634500 RepID=D8MLQ9_ERWBE|nr:MULTISPECIES: MFS transporter [Erwinia]MBN7124240.1 MFS transporter [Erwinia billingiae]QBR49770.1 MFS transporter [Erwinia sp. QL-Z3]CAX62087.1 major facilitator transporter [Erwinia billingiae Eb661]
MTTDLYTSTLKQLNAKIIPFIVICYFVANLDKTNISIAALQMNADLGLSASMYGLGVGMFYISYILFEIPSNVIMTKVGARRWIARIMITWGIVSTGMAFVHSANQLYVMRFLLGMAEAGFAPGIIYYISCWFPKSNRARAMSFFYMGSVAASIIGLPVSGAILNMHGIAEIAGWRWLFALEGIPALVLGVLVLWRLPDTPDHAPWLNPEQKSWLKQRLQQDNVGVEIGKNHAWWSALKDKTVLLLSLVWFLQAFGSIGITLFMPLIIKSMAAEQSNFVISLLSAVPFVMACLFMYLNGRHSDKTNERSWHMGLPLIFSGLALAVAIYSGNLVVSYLLLVLTVGFNFALTPIFWAVTTEKLAGVAAAASIAFINTVANFVGLGLPPILGKIKDMTNSYHYGLLIVAVALILGGVIGIIVSRPSRDALKSVPHPQSGN